MEKKLAKYRAQQEKIQESKVYRNIFGSFFSFFTQKNAKADSKEIKEDRNPYTKNTSTSAYVKKRRIMKESEDQQNLLSEVEFNSFEEESIPDDSLICCSRLQLVYYLLCFIFWGTLYIVFIKLEFGTVYFISSALVLMYLNTRTDPKKSGEVSAYSVFNKDCVSIDGTLKAEQFEREIMFGPGSVR